jgi:hypothetical protein
MATTIRVRQNVPDELVQLLRTIQINEDPRLNAVIAKAHDRGWHLATLAWILRLSSSSAVFQRIRTSRPVSADDNARRHVRVVARVLDDLGFVSTGDALRKIEQASNPAEQLERARELIDQVERRIEDRRLNPQQRRLVEEAETPNGRGVPIWKARLNGAVREIKKAREYVPADPPDLSDIEIPEPDGELGQRDGKRLDKETLGRLRELADKSSRTNGATRVDDESRRAGVEYAALLDELIRPPERGGRGFTVAYLARLIPRTDRALTATLERHGYREPAPSIRDKPAGRYVNRRIGDPRDGAKPAAP